MSFSAHADAKGIMQLIRNSEPRHIMFVHGEDVKMDFLKAKVEKVDFCQGVECVLKRYQGHFFTIFFNPSTFFLNLFFFDKND